MLERDFFLNDTLTVAEKLIGKRMSFKNNEGRVLKGIITETEGYFGDDEASHAAKGITKRNKPMFSFGGITYVYFIYGMYYCFNVSTEKEGFPSAVLIRGIKLEDPEFIVQGPGKMCKVMGISLLHNNLDVCHKNGTFNFYETGLLPKIQTSGRIGIKKNIHLPWRFFTNPKDL
jgi:DNA-3-methyladenine glycosylase